MYSLERLTCDRSREGGCWADGLPEEPAPVDAGDEVEREAEAGGEHLEEDQVHQEHVEWSPELEQIEESY